MTVIEFPKNNQNPNEKLHYYCLTFVRARDGGMTFASIRIGRTTPFINEKALSQAKASLGLDPEAVPLSVSYLGHGTMSEFRS